MFNWLRKLRNPNTRSRRCPVRPAALTLEPLETREVPALLGTGTVHNALGLVNNTVGLVGPLVGSLGVQASVSVGGESTTPTGPTGSQGGDGSSQSPPPAPTGTAVISGVVRYSRAGGDDVGPVAGATVTLTDANGNVVASTTTDANGNYSLSSLAAGSYTLSVTSNDFGSQEQAVTVADGQTTTVDFTFVS
jgi:hypothetical protein